MHNNKTRGRRSEATSAPHSTLPAGAPHAVDVSMFWNATGGIRRVLTTKHALLPGEGWRHSIVAPAAGRDRAQPAQAIGDGGFVDCGGVRLPGSGGYRVVLARGHTTRLIEALEPDVIEAADPYLMAWSALDAARRLRVPTVAFCHSNLPALAARLLGGARGAERARGRWFERRARGYLAALYNRFDAVLAPSVALAQQLRDAGVGHAELQPLGVDCSIFNPSRGAPAWRWDLLNRLGLPRRTRVAVYCGRFAPEKNLHVLADAVQRLGPGHVLLAIGSGPCPPRGDRVRCLGVQHDPLALARIVASSDVFVHAGDQETFGLAALEAMACGTPVVCADEGGLGELVRGAGLTVHGQATCAWAQAIGSALNDPSLSLTANALARARAHDWPRIVAQMSARYVGLLRGVRARREAEATSSSEEMPTLPAAYAAAPALVAAEP